MEPQADSPEFEKAINPEFEKTLNGEDFDFEFDEDFESETTSEYTVMDAMRFDRSAGTASCNFEIEEDEDDGFGTLLTKDKLEDTTERKPVVKEEEEKPVKAPPKAAAKAAKGKGKR